MMFLYRLFDSAEKLLYIGVTTDCEKRIHTHRSEKSWGNRIECASIKEYDSKQDAMRAEREAIEHENPAYNRSLQLKARNASVDSVITHFGGIRRLAHILKLNPSTIHGWKSRGIIPRWHHDRILAAAPGLKREQMGARYGR